MVLNLDFEVLVKEHFLLSEMDLLLFQTHICLFEVFCSVSSYQVRQKTEFEYAL